MNSRTPSRNDGAAREWPTNLRNPDAEGFARSAALGEQRLASKRSLVANSSRCEVGRAKSQVCDGGRRDDGRQKCEKAHADSETRRAR
jgi:hypothetical protein